MGSQLSLSNRLQVEKRDIKRQERVLDREIAMMEFEKLQCEKNIRKQVKLNMISNATIIAKNYSMIQSNITKLYKMKNQLTTLSLQMSMMHNQQQIHEAMRNVATTMKMLNTRMNLQSVKNIIREFEGEKAKHEISTEMLDTMMDNEDVDEESENEVLSRVLDEIGIKMESEIQKPPDSMIYSSTTNDVRNMEDRLSRISNNNF